VPAEQQEGGCEQPREAAKQAPGEDLGIDCEGAVRQLYSYLDGELTEQRRVQIAQHLDLCAPCAGAAVFEAELRVVIASRCKDRVPESLVRRVAESIEAERRRTIGSGEAGNPG